jgi:hypothetical protein
MKQLLPIFLSAVAICGIAAATPAVAQQMDPEGPARITAEPPHTPSHRPGNSHNGPFAALGAILAAPFDATTSSSADTTPPDAGRPITPESGNSQGEYRGVP